MMERKESAYDLEDPPYHHITFIPIEHPAAGIKTVTPATSSVGLNIKSIIRRASDGDCSRINNQKAHHEHEKKCKCVRFVPTPHYLVYESIKDQSDARHGADIWLAAPAPRVTIVREKGSNRSNILFHPSNILILIVCIAVIAVILLHKRKKKIGNPLDILMAFI